jgi:hypothetical protein
MKKLLVLLSVVFLGAVLGGCASSTDPDDGGPGPLDLSGGWYGAGTYHTGDEGEPISMPFTMELTLVHAGTLVQGSFTVVRPVRGTLPGAVTGTFDGTNIQMTLAPYGRAWGTAAAGVMSLTWYEDFGGGRGLTGTVTLGRR